MVFVWQAITAALLPIALRDVPVLLGTFLAVPVHRSTMRDGAALPRSDA